MMNRYTWPLVALLLWFLNAQDTVWTLEGLRAGIIHEANPLMRALIELHPAWFVIVKFGLVSFGIIALGQFAKSFNLARAGLVLGLVVYVPLSAWHIFIRLVHA